MFIVLPIGRDESEIRRHAWVSYSIIALNIAVFVVVNLVMASLADRTAVEAKYQESLEYLFTHPYLETPEELSRIVDGELAAALAQAAESFEKAEIVIPDAQVEREQEELDTLAAEAGEMLRKAAPQLALAYVPANGGFAAMMTSLFTHADLLHLLGNLLFFFLSGPFVEDVFGRPLFAALYFLGGIAATVAYAAQNQESLIPLVGASGAIAAVMGAYLVRFYKSKIEFLVLLFFRYSFRFFAPAFVVLPLWFAQQLLEAFRDDEGSGVAFMAHVGGFVFGAAFGTIVKFSGVEERFINPKIESQVMWKQDDRILRANAARARSDFAAAKRELGVLMSREPDNLDARRAAVDLGAEAEDWDYYGMHATKLLELYAQKQERELALDLIRETTEARQPRVPDRFYLRAGQYLERASEVEWAIGLYRSAAEIDKSGPNGLRSLVRAAQLSRQQGDVDAARDLLSEARFHPACTGELEQLVSTQIALLERKQV